MKKLLLLAILIASLHLNAQMTHVISWQIGSNGSPASPTIDVGDTVRWEWDDTAPHTVTNLAGSTETFDSGTLTGADESFSYTFTLVGDNPYQCDVHPGSMNGTISVVVLGLEENTPEGFKMISYITLDKLRLILPTQINSGEVKIYDISGKQIIDKDYDNKEELVLDVAPFNDGVYIIKIKSGKLEFAKRFIKQ